MRNLIHRIFHVDVSDKAADIIAIIVALTFALTVLSTIAALYWLLLFDQSAVNDEFTTAIWRIGTNILQVLGPILVGVLAARFTNKKHRETQSIVQDAINEQNRKLTDGLGDILGDKIAPKVADEITERNSKQLEALARQKIHLDQRDTEQDARQIRQDEAWNGVERRKSGDIKPNSTWST